MFLATPSACESIKSQQQPWRLDISPLEPLSKAASQLTFHFDMRLLKAWYWEGLAEHFATFLHPHGQVCTGLKPVAGAGSVMQSDMCWRRSALIGAALLHSRPKAEREDWLIPFSSSTPAWLWKDYIYIHTNPTQSVIYFSAKRDLNIT